MRLSHKKNIYYVIEGIEWVIAWEGRSIAQNIKRIFDLDIKLVKSSKRRLSGIKNQILHFGSRNTYLPDIHNYISNTNNIILTWYHGTDKDREYIDNLSEISKKIDVVTTSCTMSRDNLIKWGIPSEKIIIIPIGIDVGYFKSFLKQDREEIRRKLMIPEGSICIGSFQKDGDGWGEGLKPKLIKGPDIFCEVVKRLRKDFPVFVLLTGPARGFVKEKLKEAGIPFAHFYPRDVLKIPYYYRALDLYLITSRTEGGPKALMESFAMCIPVVSTDVGMVHDIAINGQNAMISPVDDILDLTDNCKSIINDGDQRVRIIENGFQKVDELDWKILAGRYYKEIYTSYL